MPKDALGHGSNPHGTHSEAIVKLPRVPKPLSEMPRAALLKALEKESTKSSEINRKLIDMGHGQVKGNEIAKMTGDPIFDHYRANSARLQELYGEREARRRYQGNEHPIRRGKF